MTRPVRVLFVALFALLLAAMLPSALASLQAQKGDPVLMTIGKSGTVLHGPSATAIFWGSEWADEGFAGDVIAGLDTLFEGLGGSHVASFLTEYYDRNGYITGSLTYGGHVLDTSDPPAGPLSNATVMDKACSVTGGNPDPDGVYYVYTSAPTAADEGICVRRIWGTCGRRKPIQVVYIPHLTGDDAPCRGVQDTGEVTGHSLALGQYASTTVNFLMTSITDPRGTGWKDASGVGISFKCEVFPPAGTYQELSNGSLWKLRSWWSNAAYLAGTGLPNQWGQPGCVY